MTTSINTAPGGAATVDPHYGPNGPIQARLRAHGVVEFEGMWLQDEGDWTALQPGDTYVAERNSGPKLLTVREVAETLSGRFAGCVVAVEPAYAFDLHECVKVSIHDTDPRFAGTAG